MRPVFHGMFYILTATDSAKRMFCPGAGQLQIQQLELQVRKCLCGNLFSLHLGRARTGNLRQKWETKPHNLSHQSYGKVRRGVSPSTKALVSGRASRNRSSNFQFPGNLAFELVLNCPAGKGIQSDLLLSKRAIGIRLPKQAWTLMLPWCPLKLVVCSEKMLPWKNFQGRVSVNGASNKIICLVVWG